MNTIIQIILVAALGFASCKKDRELCGDNCEILVVNSEIYTVNLDQPWADAMLIKEGKIIAIGKEADVEKLASQDAEILNLKGQMVMPGFHDVHTHPLEAASDNFQFTLDENEADPENYALAIEKAERQNPNAKWILGWGFDIQTLLGANRPPIDILNDISTTRPIAVMELTSHSIWVNSKALELANISNVSSDPNGGVVMKQTNGEPNGLLIDNAGNLIVDLAIASMPNNEQNDYDGLVDFALPELAKNGITSICDARTYWKRNHHKTWQRVADAGKLTARVNLGLWLYPDDEDAAQISRLKSLYSKSETALLQINQIKLYSDGIIINTTSAMHHDYKLDFFNRASNNGLNYVTESRMAKYIAELESTGFDFHIHAIGDRGVTEALNAIEQSGTSNGRHRLTHVEYVRQSDLSRFKSLNVTADAQVAGDFTNPANWSHNDQYIDATLNKAIVPIKSLTSASARITLSSDWDVSELNPLIGLQNAVTRAPQNISLEEAIKAYTISAAYVMRQEDKVGSLEIGKEADFVVLNQNLFEIASNEIANTKVTGTYLKGERIY